MTTLAAGGHPSHDSCTYGGAPLLPCYRATRGSDMATGLGTPQAAFLIGDLLRERPGPAPHRRDQHG